tara:strand:+ start:1155 stop:1646 length:492 start_codon:yes stop_codon:yes gene_type:complete
MANDAKYKSRASVFSDEIKASMSGKCDFNVEGATGHYWLYASKLVSNSSGDLLSTANDLLGSGTALATNDKILWIAIKNTSTTATDGVVICLDAGTAAWNLGDGIAIGAGEMICLKVPQCTVADLHAISVTMSKEAGVPSTTHAGGVTVQVAAVINDVSEGGG